MPRFFVQQSQIENGVVTVTGNDAQHISRSLRMASGEHITVCDMQSLEYDCVLERFGTTVTARVVGTRSISTEPPFRAVLWQALPKSDKLDTIIQKSVECGVSEIRLFSSERCIVKPSAADRQSREERRARIALEAAKQCGRGIIPPVYSATGFDEMIKSASCAELPVFCYEGEGTEPLGTVLRRRPGGLTADGLTVSIVVGPEGGFSDDEAKKARNAGMIMTGLGKRILRTETAAGFVLSALVYELELCR